MYDAQLGRFHVQDPLAAKYFGWSPYNYVGNNPIKRTDPNGKEWDSDDDKEKAKKIQGKIVEKNKALGKTIENKQKRYNKAISDGNHDKADKLNDAIADLNGRVEINKRVIKEITDIGDKEGIKFKFGNNVQTTIDNNGNEIKSAHLERDIGGTYIINNTGQLSNQAHEIIHAGQVADDLFVLKLGTSDEYIKQQPGLTNTIIETPAYKAQYGIDTNLPFNVNGINDPNFIRKVDAFIKSNPHY